MVAIREKKLRASLNITVNIDTKEDFEIELQTETIQDYKDIYNIDLVRTMSEAIKTQILLNKDKLCNYQIAA